MPFQQKVIFSQFELSALHLEDEHSTTELTRWYSFLKHCGLSSLIAKKKIAAQTTWWDVLLLLANSSADSSNEDMTLGH